VENAPTTGGTRWPWKSSRTKRVGSRMRRSRWAQEQEDDGEILHFNF